MRTSKKILSVVLALMMLLSVVALGAYAIPADTICEMSLTTDKDTYAAGDEVTVTFWAQTAAEVPSVEMMGQYIIGYDAAGLEPYSTSTDLTAHGFSAASAHAAAFDNSMSQVVDNDTLLGMGTTISNGTAIIGYFVAEMDDTYVASNDAPVELFSIKLKVKADAADGDYTIAFNEDSFSDYNAYITDSAINGLYGDVPSDMGLTSCSKMWAFKSVTIHVGATGPAVAHKKAQVKMTLNEGKTALAEVADPIQLRVTSVITAADFDAYFSETTEHNTDTASDKNAITSVGIVAYKGAAADFDEATAKALVTDGTAAANYASAETDYISNVGGEYTFGAIIKGSRSDAFASDVTYLGYVRYLDASGAAQIIFYEAAVTKTITDTTVSNYIAAQNA